MKSAGKPLFPVGRVLAVVQRRERDDPGVEPRVPHVRDPRDRGPAAAARDLDGVDERPVRGVPLERVPALDRPLPQLLATAHDVERAARLAVEDRERQPVVALLRDHPVAHVQEPVELALVAEGRDPPDPVDDLHDLVAEAAVHLLRGQGLTRLVVDLAHADEPLVDEPEQERRLAAPAVRVAVGVRLEVVEEVPALEIVDDRLGNGGRLAPGEPAEPLEIAAVLVDRADDREPERLPELVVLGAAAGGDVDDPGPLLLADRGPRSRPGARTPRLRTPSRRRAARRTGPGSASRPDRCRLLLERSSKGRRAASLRRPFASQCSPSPWRIRT